MGGFRQRGRRRELLLHGLDHLAADALLLQVDCVAGLQGGRKTVRTNMIDDQRFVNVGPGQRNDVGYGQFVFGSFGKRQRAHSGRS